MIKYFLNKINGYFKKINIIFYHLEAQFILKLQQDKSLIVIYNLIFLIYILIIIMVKFILNLYFIKKLIIKLKKKKASSGSSIYIYKGYKVEFDLNF